ncbi:MAG: hypothetical protein ACE5FS_08775 [Paracoccaceae bacterium]
MLTITPIGSCRIANPIRLGAKRYRYRVNSSRIYGYTHSSAEALQQIRYLKRAFAPIEAVRPLLMPNIDEAQNRRLLHAPSDLYFVEISSAKIAMVADTHVQWNHVARHFAAFLCDRERARKFWALASGETEEEKRRFLSASRVFRRLSATDRWLLQNMTLRHCDAAWLHRDIGEIVELLPRCVFVTHCNAAMANGERIPSRAAFISVLRWVLEDLGAEYFDPTEEMERFGQARALKDERGSLSHYAPEFENRLLEIWNERYFERFAKPQRGRKARHAGAVLAGAV